MVCNVSIYYHLYTQGYETLNGIRNINNIKYKQDLLYEYKI